MVDNDDHSIGVLIDLDLAVRLKDGDKTLPFKPAPGGTFPFRAIDILEKGEPVETLFYRHDLESFLYTLIWILSYYPDDSSRRVQWSDWYKGSPESIARLKTGLLASGARGVPAGPLTTSWVPRLARLFRDGLRFFAMNPVADAETLGGQVTFASFMSILEPSRATMN